MLQTLTYKKENNIATITFNRPEAFNTFNEVMAQELEEVTTQAAEDQSVRVVCINGAGPLFMAGGDIQHFFKHMQEMPNGVMKIVRTLNASITNLMQMPKPVLASAHGSVAGVGLSILMASDLAIAAANTKFSMAYCGLGISPDGGAAFNLPRLVGHKKAMEWILLSEIFDAQTALQNGIINWVVTEEALHTETDKLLMRLANGPTRAYAASKRLVNDSWHTSIATHLENEGKAFAFGTTTKDFQEGVQSFLLKQKPTFTGV